MQPAHQQALESDWYFPLASRMFTGPTFGQSDKATSQSSIETPDPRPRQHLFGDWGGERTSLASNFFYVADLQANPIGGLEQTQVRWGRIRGTMDVDFGKLGDWNG
jgi:hypothetical protein